MTDSVDPMKDGGLFTSQKQNFGWFPKLPLIRTPFTKWTASIFPDHQGKSCGDYEMDFYRCASRYGSARAEVECYREIADYMECTNATKMVNFDKI